MFYIYLVRKMIDIFNMIIHGWQWIWNEDVKTSEWSYDKFRMRRLHKQNASEQKRVVNVLYAQISVRISLVNE